MANWNKISNKGNVDDRRGASAGMVGGMSITGVLLLMGVSYLMGGNPLDVLNQVDINQIQTSTTETNSTEFDGEDSYEQFATAVLGSNNEFWLGMLTNKNVVYTPPTLVLFRNQTASGCGGASSAMGPHYCPTDTTIYLDETFFEVLQTSYGARGGDVAEAYVIAHEVGHHVQNLLGTIGQSQKSNDDSVQIELQADCFAGLWAGSLKDEGIFEINEITEAMDAAAAVGDDHIQETMQGGINPESWTHGSSADRVKSFTQGYDSDNINVCLNN